MRGERTRAVFVEVVDELLEAVGVRGGDRASDGAAEQVIRRVIDQTQHIAERVSDFRAVAVRGLNRRCGGSQFELVAALVEVAHVIDQIINRLGRQVGIGMDDLFGVPFRRA